jgi:hypothetical protein
VKHSAGLLVELVQHKMHARLEDLLDLRSASTRMLQLELASVILDLRDQDRIVIEIQMLVVQLSAAHHLQV